MRYILYILVVFIFPFIGSIVYGVGPSTACTLQYDPVCGSVPVQCIAAPCYPVRQTFGNQCLANLANATDITAGECGTPPPVVGGDIDTHGCIRSAGYRWEPRAQKCLRPWESRVRILYVAPDTQVCPGTLVAECLQVRLSFERFWRSIIGNITGFNYVRGYTYRLLVLESRVYNRPILLETGSYIHPIDVPIVSYSLIRVLNSRPTPIVTDNSPIIGTWKLTNFNASDVSTGNFSATFTRNQFSIKLCSTISGSYSLRGNTIIAPKTITTLMYGITTLMYCDGLPMTLENAWGLDAATYTLTSIPVMVGSTSPSMQLVITMRNGHVFTFTK